MRRIKYLISNLKDQSKRSNFDLTMIPRETLHKFIISIIFLAGSTLTYVNAKLDGTPHLDTILSSKLLIATGENVQAGYYYVTKKQGQKNCRVFKSKVKIENIYGKSFIKFHHPPKDINPEKLTKYDVYKFTKNEKNELCSHHNVIFSP